MFEEVSNSIKAYLYERAVSPLMGGFIISWCIWNYKLILLVISETPILEKFSIINDKLYSTWFEIIIYGLALPLTTTAIYIFLYPYPAEYVFRFTQKRQRRLSNIKREIEGSTLLSIDEAREIRHKQYILEEQYNIAIDKKNNEIEKLKQDIITLSKENKATDIDVSQKKTRWLSDDVNLNEIEEKILVNIEKHNMSENDILKMLNNDASDTEIKYYIGSLEGHGLITHDRNNSIGYDVYSITHEGRAYIVEILNKAK